jgi:electron transfer flavoprotein alpha subunit
VKIVCLVKQVPHPEAIEFDEETKALKREGVPLELNLFDRYAVQHAVNLRAQTGGEVVVMTMGPPQAAEALRETLALGPERGIHLSDRVFALADTLATSRTLSLALEQEGANLVLCGRKTLDSETWQVPPEVAAFLGWPVLTSVTDLELIGDHVRATRETDEGEDVYEVELPAVLSIARPPAAAASGTASEPAEPRIDVWTATDLVTDVRPNDKRFGQTGSPTRVLAVRDVTPERAGERATDPADAAARASARLDELETAPAPWEKPAHIAEQPGASYDCWTVVELVGGRAARVSLELLGKGRELAGKLGGRNIALVAGHGVTAASEQAARHGAEVIYELDDPLLAEYHPERRAAALRQVVERERPHVLLIPATTAGRDYGPLLAGQLELGMTGDCVNVDISKAGRLLQTKPAYGGNIVSVIMGRTTPQLATVRPRMFEPVQPREEAWAEIQRVALEQLVEPRTRLVDRRNGAVSAAYRLDEAEVLVLVGPEAANADAVAEIEALAEPAGAAVGGTREVCEAGWLPLNRHVGLYGRPVAPRLLITVGVPGDFEHLTGFVKAGVIVALNEDPSAPMLAAADVGLTGPWREALPVFLQAL